MDELNNTLNEILQDKNANLKPENLKAGVTCLGVEGVAQIGGIPDNSIVINLDDYPNLSLSDDILICDSFHLIQVQSDSVTIDNILLYRNMNNDTGYITFDVMSGIDISENSYMVTITLNYYGYDNLEIKYILPALSSNVKQTIHVDADIPIRYMTLSPSNGVTTSIFPAPEIKHFVPTTQDENFEVLDTWIEKYEGNNYQFYSTIKNISIPNDKLVSYTIYFHDEPVNGNSNMLGNSNFELRKALDINEITTVKSVGYGYNSDDWFDKIDNCSVSSVNITYVPIDISLPMNSLGILDTNTDQVCINLIRQPVLTYQKENTNATLYFEFLTLDEPVLGKSNIAFTFTDNTTYETDFIFSVNANNNSVRPWY